MRRLIWIAAALLGTAAGAPPAVAAQDVGLAIGSRPAPLVMEDVDGKPVNLAQYIGKKPVVLEFWATWCSVCAALQPRIDAAERRFGTNVQFVTVAVGVNQTARSIKRHLEKHRVAGVLVFSLGMTALLVAVGLFSGTLAALPRSGMWMVWVKRVAGVILIGMAEYYFIQMGMVM